MDVAEKGVITRTRSKIPTLTTSLSDVLEQQIPEDQARAASLAATQITFTRSPRQAAQSHLKIQLKSQKFTRNYPAPISAGLVSVVVMMGVLGGGASGQAPTNTLD